MTPTVMPAMMSSRRCLLTSYADSQRRQGKRTTSKRFMCQRHVWLPPLGLPKLLLMRFRASSLYLPRGEVQLLPTNVLMLVRILLLHPLGPD